MFEVGILNSQGLNVLLIGSENTEYILSSKFLRKMYAVSDKNVEGVVNISFNTFKELAQKCKTLQIDLVLVEDERWINEGIADVMKSNYINCVAPTSDWTKLALSNSYARQLLGKYGFNLPKTTLLPSEFPLIVKGDGVLKKADCLQDVIKIRQEVYNTSPEIAAGLYLEKYLDGEKFYIISLYDGKNLITFPVENVPEEMLSEFSKKTEVMLNKENAIFLGFIQSEVILCDNMLYNTGFKFGFRKINCDIDILYLLWMAIYGKLNEISIT